MSTFSEAIDRLAAISRPRIGFGLKDSNQGILQSLELAKALADIVLVGPTHISSVDGFEVVTSESPESELARLLCSGEVAGIVRGTLDGALTYEAYQKLSGCRHEVFPALFKDPFGREFLLGPISNPETWSRESRLEEALGMAKFAESWGIDARVAVYTGVRHYTYERRKHETEGVLGVLNQTYRDADWIVDGLRERGIHEAKNWSIDFNPAVEQGFNIHVPVNGMVGNQVFRALLLCGSTVLATPRLGLPHCYEDNSQTEKDFGVHVRAVTAMVNRRSVGC